MKDYKHYWGSKKKQRQKTYNKFHCKVSFTPNLAHTHAHTLNRQSRERVTRRQLLDQTDALQLLLASAGATGKGHNVR